MERKNNNMLNSIVVRKNQTILFFILFFLLFSFVYSGENVTKEYTKQLKGEWLAGEMFVAQPSSQLWQDIKSIVFREENIVEWTYVKDGKEKKETGRYFLWIEDDSENTRQLPTLFVAPLRYENPMISSIRLLHLSDIEIDFDSRFNKDIYGKILKAKTGDRKRLIFVKNKEKNPPKN